MRNLVGENSRTRGKMSHKRTGQAPVLLSEEEERELLKRTRTGDIVARERIILSNIGLVRKLAHHYKQYGIPLSDLISEGHLGLIHAIDRFDLSSKNRLGTYATWWIRHYIRRAIALQSRAMRIPLPVFQNLALLHRTSEELRRKLKREPSTMDLARALGFSVTKVQTLKRVAGFSVSLQGEKDDESMSLIDRLADSSEPTPLENLVNKSLPYEIQRSLKVLSDREREIVILRYGLNGGHILSCDEVGQRYGLTRERIRQIEQESLKKLRRFF